MSIQNIPINLTSTAIPPSADGNYTYNQSGLLIPHEALRREMIRAKNAFDKFDPIAHPWQALYIKLWLHEFFVAIVHEHHDLEETIMAPEMKKLNVEIPDHLNGAHKALLESLQKLELLSDELLTLVRGGGAEATLLTEKLNELKTCYNDTHTDMFQHFHEEEIFWSEAILKVPKKDWDRIETSIKKIAQSTKPGEMIFCSILDSMGYCFKNCAFRPEDTRWCSAELVQKIILSEVPYPVRAFIFPGFNKRYQRHKTMITAIGGDSDVLKLYNPAGTEQAGCACIIA